MITNKAEAETRPTDARQCLGASLRPAGALVGQKVDRGCHPVLLEQAGLHHVNCSFRPRPGSVPSGSLGIMVELRPLFG